MSVINLPNQGLGYDFRGAHDVSIPGSIGGHEYGGAQYLFLYQGSEFLVGDSKIHALKSTDLGVTWTDTGSILIPKVVGGSPTNFATIRYTTCMDGTTVYLMAIDLDGTGDTSASTDWHTGPILLYKYDLIANTFATSAISGAPTVFKGWNGSSYSPRGSICLHLLRRGAGDMLLLYTDMEVMGANKYGRIAVSTFNGSSCGTGVVLGGQAGVAGVFVESCATFDAAHNLHVILLAGASYLHIAMSPAGAFGTLQTLETTVFRFNLTSNLLDFPGTADTIAFLGVRDSLFGNTSGDLMIYSAPGGSLSPTWTSHAILAGTPNVVMDSRQAPGHVSSLGYLDGTLYAFWTQNGIPGHWDSAYTMGEIRSSTTSAANLTTWVAETSVMGPYDADPAFWGISQIMVWPGPEIGLGVLGNFEGWDDGGTGDPIEMSKLLVYPPGGGGGGGPTITCGSPPDGAAGTPYSHTFPVTDAPPGSTVSITSGALPPGLTLDSSGTATGTPTTVGTYDFEVTLTPAARSVRSGSSVTLPTTPQGYDNGGSPFAAPGIEYGGKQYLFVHQGAEFFVGDAGMHILRSADNGLTWTDLASFVVIVGGATPVGNMGYTVCQDGSVAYILYTDMGGSHASGWTSPADAATGPLYLRIFNLATESLGGETTTGFQVYKDSFGLHSHMNLVRRGAGDMLFVYSSIPEFLSSNYYFRVSVTTFNGSAFGTPALIPGQAGNIETYRQTCAGVDDTDIVHIILLTAATTHHLHSGLNGTTFGSTTAVNTHFGYTELTSRLVSYSGSIAFAASGTQYTYDKTVYHAASGTVNPTWDTHNIDTFSPVIANGSIFNEQPFDLAYLDGNLHLFWTRSGSEPDDWTARFGMGVIQHSQTAITDLTTWTAEDTIIDNPGPPTSKWAAAQVCVYAGATIGIGIFGGFTGISLPDPPANPVENGQFARIPPAGGGGGEPVSVDCSISVGMGIDCNSPPDGALGDPYSHPLTITGAPAGSTVSITGGVLPPGVTIDDTGLISGTPTLAGTYTYTATVTPPITRSGRTASTTLITPASTFADAVSQNGYGFEYLGKLYLFTFRFTDDTGAIDNHFRCLQSSDSGATWTEILGPQWPFTLGAFLNAGWPVAYSVARDGTNVILIWVNATKDGSHFNWTDFSISKVVFNLSANTWGTVTTVLAPFYGLMDNHDQSPATDHSNGATIYLIVRGPGDYLVYVPGVESGVSPSLRGTATVVPYNGSSFGGAMPIPGQTAGKWYVPCGSVYDPVSGNTHFLMAGGNTSSGQPKLFHAALSSGNTYGSMTAIMDNAVTPGDWNAGTVTAADGVSQPIIYSDGVNRKIGIATSVYGPSPPFSIYVRFFSAIETLNPTFTHSEITTEQWPVTVGDIPKFSIHAEVFSLATNGTTMIATWVSYDGNALDPSDIYYSTTPVAGTLTWTAPAVIIPTPPPLSGISGPEPYVNEQGLAIPMTGGFGVVGHAQNWSFKPPYLVSQFSFVAADDGGGGGTIEPVSVTCSTTVGYGDLSTSCGGPPAYTVGVAGAAYRPPIVMGSIGLPPVYDQNDTLVWTFPVVPPPGFHWETNPASDNYGYLVGTPTVSGVQSFTYTVSTPDGQSITNTCPLDVAPADDGGGGGGGDGDGGIEITCANPPGGKVGVPYSHTFPVTGATGPTRYSVVVGALPPGVHLDPATGDLSGTPTAPGTYSFSVKVQQ